MCAVWTVCSSKKEMRRDCSSGSLGCSRCGTGRFVLWTDDAVSVVGRKQSQEHMTTHSYARKDSAAPPHHSTRNTSTLQWRLCRCRYGYIAVETTCYVARRCCQRGKNISHNSDTSNHATYTVTVGLSGNRTTSSYSEYDVFLEP